MRYCDVPAVNGTPDNPRPCTGHLSKFDDCLAEGLWEMAEQSDDWAGDVTTVGCVTLVVVSEPEPVDVEGQGDRQVMVPSGNYLVWTATTGRVSIGVVDTADEGREIVDRMSQEMAAALNP